MSQTTKQFTVIVPKTLTWDKFMALFLTVVWVFKAPFRNVEVLFEDQFGPENPMPSDVPDIDVRSPYNRSEGRYGSATEFVASTNDLLDDPAVKELVTLLNRNNDNGFLKSYPKSLVWLIRELYEVGHNVDAYAHRREVIEMMWPVARAYFAAAEVNLPAVITMNPFTMGGYSDMLSLLGEDFIKRQRALEPLVRGFEKAETRRKQARERAKAIVPKLFTVRAVNGGTAPAHLIETDDQKVAGPYFKANPGIALLVVRMRNGRYAIFCRGKQDMRQIYDALNNEEPEKWFLDERPQSPLVLNGSQSRDAEPSTLPPTMLVEIIQQAHMHNPSNCW